MSTTLFWRVLHTLRYQTRYEVLIRSAWHFIGIRANQNCGNSNSFIHAYEISQKNKVESLKEIKQIKQLDRILMNLFWYSFLVSKTTTGYYEFQFLCTCG